MSGLEVVAAVSAVVSAFHGGSELLKHIKAKRRVKAQQAQQEFEEKQLQDSLVSGEQQIALRYDQDLRQFGDLMRVGDVVARDRLQHITIMMQGEVIKGLQQAAQYESAVLNLTLLHEASIMNRKDTIVTLDELKQRLLIRMPINQPPASHHNPSTSWSFSASTRTRGASMSNEAPSTSSNQTSTTTPQFHQDRPRLIVGFEDPPQGRMMAANQSRPARAPADIHYSQAFQHAMDARGITDPSAMNEEIDEIMDSYQGLQISRESREPWSATQYGSRRSTQPMPSTRYPPSPDPSKSNRDSAHIPSNLPPTPEEYGSRQYPQQPAFNKGIFGQHQQPAQNHQQPAQNLQQPAQNPYPQMQTQTLAPPFRWSTNSATSSTYSDPQSLNRNSSTSSQESHTQAHPSPLMRTMRSPSSPNEPYQYHENQHASQSPSSPAYTPEIHSIAPLSPQDSRGQYIYPSPTTSYAQSPPIPAAVSLPHVYAGYATAYSQPQSHSIPSFHQQPPIAPDHDVNSDTQSRPQYHLWPATARNPSSPYSTTSERTVTQSVSSASTLGTAPASSRIRHASIAPSIASTDSSSSIPFGILPSSRSSKIIRADTIQSGPAGSEKMMDGRPCKANNYWGFCKGAWTIREDQKKGLSLRVQPSGMYNTREVWECCACSFQGAMFSTPHPSKKNKQVNVVDPRVQTSASGVRYKWIFLAKSHVKKKSTDSQTTENNFGCIICSLEDKVSSIYGGVETLMNHIALSHVADLSENTRRKARCIVGRAPGPNEVDWDVNIPVFARVEELP
ncbi:hypothetical protein CC86DRAFT_404650 [Ophiobolus disseminans]|uniref:Uncharacterized protein n=1 Tax=Ophiobolus disseminans TaxID=1469910 RepID=A0A6A7A631_9PLEO|nr:hypothetical protein CC86DRAFT_404650 [Ophiobolus disseminans]